MTPEHVRAALSPELAARAVRAAFAEQVAGRTATSQPPLLRLPVGDGALLQVKGARVGDVAGFRLGGEREHRHVDEGRRLVLYAVDSLLPLALVDERDLFRHRVGAQVAVAIAALRPARARCLTVVGAGRLARAAVEAVQALTPFARVRVHSRTAASREQLVGDLAGVVPGEVIAAPELDPAVRDADVVLTITTAQAPFLRGDVLTPGTLLVSAGGGWECDAEAYRRAGRIVVDDWQHCRQVGDLRALSAAGAVTESMVTATLGEVVTKGAAPCGPEELVVVVPQGMAILDVALAAAVLDAGAEKEPGAHA